MRTRDGVGSVLPAVWNAIYGKKAERVGTSVMAIVTSIILERRHLMRKNPEVLANAKVFEEWVERQLKREIGRLRKQLQRGPASVGDYLKGQSTKGYAPESLGLPRSSLLFLLDDDDLESAINKLQPKDPDQQMLYRALARLRLLKEWGYNTLARVVFGPRLTEMQLENNADNIRKWLREAMRDVREAGQESKRRAGRARKWTESRP